MNLRNVFGRSAAPSVRLASFHFGLLLACFFALRLVLFFAFKPPGPLPVLEVCLAFLVGLHLDLGIALLFTLPVLAWFAVMPRRWVPSLSHRVLFKIASISYWMLLLFLLGAEYYFFEEFNSRFNTVAVDYLLYPHEVFFNIWESYPVVWVVGGCLVGAFLLVLATSKFQPAIREWNVPLKRRWLHLGAGAALAALLLLTVSFKETRFSQERVLNEIAGNGPMAFAAALMTHELDFPGFYQTLEPTEAFARTRRLLAEPDATFTGATNSVQRRIAGDPTRPKFNVVLFLEESFGSEFWGSLGRPGPTLTPEMDRLALTEGMFFTNFYASGNRTVRGLEGVLCSFPPLPGDSIVVRSHSENVETLARVLKRDGYATEFLYGGRGIFDGMRAFMLRNGYDSFVELKHFPKPTFTTVWGVCDEDLYRKALEDFRALAATGQPFFGTILSVSNHKPFTYPPGKIPEDPNERKRENAVKYSDYALGQFFKEVRKESYFTNTIFVVVADHGARVYGSQDIPIHSYEIPFLITGPAVVKAPQTISQFGCSLDVGPTILGLLGRPYDSLFFGRDVLRCTPEQEMVLMHHNRDIGLYKRNRLAVLGLNKTVEFYHGNPKSEELRKNKKPDAADEELRKDAISIYQTADYLYMRDLYRLQTQEAPRASAASVTQTRN